MINKYINIDKGSKAKTFISVLLSIVLVCSMFCISSCGINKGQNKDSIDICRASEPLSLDPGLNTTVDGSILINHLFSGLAQWKKDPVSGEVVVVKDLCEELVEPVANADGTYTYTYKLNRDAKWNDGKPVVAQDYVFGWNRSASVELASDFGYMFENVLGYDDIWADNPPANAKLAISALDDYTFQVTTTSKVAYWNELLAFPVFLPMRQDICDSEGMWAAKPETYISNGAYKMTQWTHNSLIVTEKSDTYPFKDEITMPKINWYLSDNANNQLANFKNGDWQLIKDIPTNEIASIKKQYPEKFHTDDQVGVYYIAWQIDFDLSPVGGQKLTDEQQAEVRRAISLMIDRNYICNNIVQQGEIPAATFVPKGVKEANGSQFYLNAGGANKGYYGYFKTDEDNIKENYGKAIEILHKYYHFNDDGDITDFPPMTYIYNTNEGHKAIAEYLQNVLSTVGIKLSLENQEWATFLATKKQGNFTMCRDSWVADYNDATCYLNLPVTTAGNNDAKFGKGEHKNKAIYTLDLSDIPGYESKSVQNGTWAQTYDTVIKYASDEENLAIRDKLLHRAEDLVMSTGALVPLYYYTETYLLQPNVKGFYSNPLGCWFLKQVTVD